MTDTRVDIKENMIVIAMEDSHNPSMLKVSIPQIMCDQSYNEVIINKAIKNSSMLCNKTPPALSNTFTVQNYITLNVVKPLYANIPDSDTQIEVGLGDIKMGDKLLAVFVDNNPSSAYIIAKI